MADHPNASRSDRQLFFRAFAKVWCHPPIGADFAGLIMKHTPHSLATLRVNVPLSRFGQFAKAYKCARGDAMNRRELRIW